ncbi:unnamed protein product [Acanthoscelides obtectus]|uniref:Uncharacterized protein n=1 Tax=Acanthoscelides obtectus TaxID=200917 RepID=A0A9P0KQQ1_ACAOB|nr:unnamed protein product [Acanthoscelides obtectus]CAK1674705.1 hypothetical protein AOBTE_LOCUS29714 [Acanthoscelides obtectus]
MSEDKACKTFGITLALEGKRLRKVLPKNLTRHATELSEVHITFLHVVILDLGSYSFDFDKMNGSFQASSTERRVVTSIEQNLSVPRYNSNLYRKNNRAVSKKKERLTISSKMFQPSILQRQDYKDAECQKTLMESL